MPGPTNEPRVLAADVAAVLRRRIVADDPSRAEVRAAIAAEAGCSAETIKRVMNGHWETLELSRADAILVAAGGHISECSLVWPDA